MSKTQVSGSLIVRDKNLLMVYDDKTEKWSVPTGERERGELSAETAERLAEEHTGCKSEAERYMSKLKTTFEIEGEKHKWQPYLVQIEGEPEEADWVNLAEIESDQVDKPLRRIFDKLKDKI